MKKKLLIILLISAALVAMLISGCNINSAANDPDYVEVESVRIPSMNAYLSPAGDTSEFQLEAYTIPENSTNKKLEYYVSPEFSEYFSISQTGLIRARKITSDLETVPTVRIYSTSNPQAFTTVQVIIEDVAVRQIDFVDTDKKIVSEMDVLLSLKTYPLNLQITPYHAQDGRDITFQSLDTDIVSVSSTGELTLLKTGIVTIIARGQTLQGTTIEGRVRISVKNEEGSYRLEINDDARFDQVIGSPQTISFNLISLDPKSDPNPTIFWDVGETRQSQQDNKLDYEHIPNESNPTSYTIKVRILQKNAREEIILESPAINIFYPFTGFELDMNEPIERKYYYGEQAVFEPLLSISSAEQLEWYIKQQGEKGYGELIDVTDYAVNNGALTYEVLRDGVQEITMLAKNSSQAVVEHQNFIMNIVRYVSGDKVIINPIGIESEKPPESYDWYLHNYFPNNPENLRIGKGIFLQTTVKDEPLAYRTSEVGYYVMSAIPTVDGALVTEIVDGDTKTMTGYTAPFRVWDETGVSNIFDVAVDGTVINNVIYPVIKWNAVSGVNRFIVELECGGNAYILDTEKGDADGLGFVFLNNAIAIPPAIADFSTSIYARVKQAGGVYSAEATYEKNTFSALSSSYFAELAAGVNRTITSLQELGALINYVKDHTPLSLRTREEGDFSTYGVSIYTALRYSQFDENLYPINADIPSKLSESQINMFSLLYAAINVFGSQGITGLGVNIEGENFYKVFITVRNSGSPLYEQASERLFVGDVDFTDESRPEGYTDFNITLKSGENVTTAEGLLQSAERGRNPAPVSGSEAAAVYAEIAEILNSIISEKMSQMQKLEAIYNFIIKEIEFDSALQAIAVTTSANRRQDWRDFEGFYLKAIMHKKAVSEGIAKIFSLMCWMEGITSYRVKGQLNGVERHWNKVYAGGNWYNIDASAGRIQFTENGTRYACATHKYLMVSDSSFKSYGYTVYGGYPEATTDYQYDSTHIVRTSQSDYEDIISGILQSAPENQVYEIYFEESFLSDLMELLEGYTLRNLGTSLVLIFY